MNCPGVLDERVCVLLCFIMWQPILSGMFVGFFLARELAGQKNANSPRILEVKPSLLQGSQDESGCRPPDHHAVCKIAASARKPEVTLAGGCSIFMLLFFFCRPAGVSCTSKGMQACTVCLFSRALETGSLLAAAKPQQPASSAWKVRICVHGRRDSSNKYMNRSAAGNLPLSAQSHFLFDRKAFWSRAHCLFM